MNDDRQIDPIRRQLGALIEQTHTRVTAAARLLEHKAKAAPTSSTAEVLAAEAARAAQASLTPGGKQQ